MPTYVRQHRSPCLQWFIDGQKVPATAPDGLGTSRSWMTEWTIFYWGWWIAWAPFVGMFIAKISRGRTVRNIINGAMTGPVLYGCAAAPVPLCMQYLTMYYSCAHCA